MLKKVAYLKDFFLAQKKEQKRDLFSCSEKRQNNPLCLGVFFSNGLHNNPAPRTPPSNKVSLTPRKGQFDAWFWLNPAAGPPLSVENTIIEFCNIPDVCRAFTIRPTLSSSLCRFAANFLLSQQSILPLSYVLFQASGKSNVAPRYRETCFFSELPTTL